MKTYFIIDDTTTAAATCDFLPLTAAAEAEALKQAWAAWNRLTAHDQRKRDSFALCYGSLDEDGIPDGDYDEIIDIVKAAPVYAAFDEDAAAIRADLETEMANGYRQAMDADLELRLDDLRKWYKEQYPDLF